MTNRMTTRRHGFAWWTRLALALVAVLLVVTWITGVLIKSNMLKQNPAPGQMVSVDGHKMHIHCTGEGSPTVIFAAGLDDFSIF